MKYITDIEFVNESEKPSAVTIGKFDGLHRGHRYLIDGITKKKEEGYLACVISFDIPPRARIENEMSRSAGEPGAESVSGREIRLLATRSEKCRILEEAGVDLYLELSFTERLMRMAPVDFIKMLCEKISMRYLAVGTDFRFGYRGAGDVKMLSALSRSCGFDLEIVKKLHVGNREISSSCIREMISLGDMDSAAEMLGRRYSATGTVVRGNHIGTDRLMRPTINIYPEPEKLLPPNGVYISEVRLKDSVIPGITNIGIRPTIREYAKRVGIETHLLDFSGDVYDETATVSLIKYLRPEIRFDSLKKLHAQIESDVNSAVEYHQLQG